MSEYWTAITNANDSTACWKISTGSASNGSAPTTSAAASQRLWNYYEGTAGQFYAAQFYIGSNQPIYVPFERELIHDPWNYIYVPGNGIEDILRQQNEQLTDVQRKAFATQHLAPIDEALEIEGAKKVLTHLEQLLNDETYRNFQLLEINKVNKILGLKECLWDAQAVRNRIQDIKFQHNPRKAWGARAWKFIHAEAERRAEELFNDIFTPEEIMKLNTDKRLLISRGDLAFELTADGGINQLLPDGQKQGWCLVSKEYGLALKDLLVMKKLILESAPEIVLQIANKRSPFN